MARTFAASRAEVYRASFIRIRMQRDVVDVIEEDSG